MNMKLPKNLHPLYKPYGQFQIDTIAHGVIHDFAGLLLPVGMGKTYCAANIGRWRIQNCNVNKVLVLCPATILQKWKEEIYKFSGHNSNILHHPTKQKRTEIIKDFISNETKYGLINYEALPIYFNLLKQIPIDMIIADESSRYIKNLVSSQRNEDGIFKLVKRTHSAILLGDLAKFKLILTGTLITSKPLDIWSQFKFLDGGLTFGINYYSWRNTFFNKVNYPGYTKWEIKREMIPLLHRMIYSICIRFEKSDVMKDLPESIYSLIPIPLEGGLKRTYQKLQKKIISEIETMEGSTSVNITNIFTKLIRLQQVTSGFIKGDDGGIRELKQQPKLKAVLEEIDTILASSESVIIWCKFRPTIKMISNALTSWGVKHTVMTGSDNPKQKANKWQGFQRSKTINIFIGQVVAGGIGIELFKIDTTDKYQHILFVENTFVLDHRMQALGRNEQRIGQNANCRIVDFIVKDSIDERIMEVIKQDKEVSDMIMKGGIRKFLT